MSEGGSPFLRRFPFVARSVALAVLLVAACCGATAAAEWRIAKISGDVRVHGAENVWVKARAGQSLRPGESVWTGRRSRAQIETDQGSVILRSRSLVKVPSQKLPKDAAVLLQGQGKVEASVERREERHFSIQTPFLAAVVKGTEFTLEMGSQSTNLSVRSGTVSAVSVGSGEEVDVKSGQTLITGNRAGAGLGEPRSGNGSSGHDTGHGNDVVDGNRSGRFADRGNGTGDGDGTGEGDDDDDDDDDDEDIDVL